MMKAAARIHSNRKQRRFAASTRGRKLMDAATADKLKELGEAEAKLMAEQAEQAPSKTQKLGDLNPEERAERMQKLLAGRVVPTNDTARYLVNKLRSVLAESKQVGDQMQQHRLAATQAENRLRELSGMRAGYAQDLEQWDVIEVAPAS